MRQPIFRKQPRAKTQDLHWVVWFPYPISWFRALILIPIAFPGSRLIVFGFGLFILTTISNSPKALIFFVVLGVLLPTVILSYPYHVFWFVWKKKQPSNRWPKWLPNRSSLWEGFYATVVIGISFLSILAIFAGLWFVSCKLSHETAEQVSRCTGGGVGRTAGGIFSSTDNLIKDNGRGAINLDPDNFTVRPWVVIWLIIAAYLYQVEYLVKQRFVPWLKGTFQSYRSRK